MINSVSQISSNNTAFQSNKTVNNFFRQNEQRQDLYISSKVKESSDENKLSKPYNVNSVSFQGSGYEFGLKKQKNLPCPCCGKIMITVEEQKEFANYMEKATGKNLIKGLEMYYDRLPDTEQKVCDVLIQLAEKKYPDDTIKGLLKKQRDTSLKNVEKKQQEILKDISHTVRNLNGKTKINTINSLECISKKLDIVTFYKDEAKTFISELTKSAKKETDSENKEILELILEKSKKLPLPSTDKDSFIVIFSRDTDKDIALRLISPATISVEHIIPIHKGGTDSDWNKLLFCKDCNNRRALLPYDELVEEFPDMIENTKKHFDEVMHRISRREIRGYDLYPRNVCSTLSEVTGGIINVDTSILNPKKVIKVHRQVLSRVASLI